MLQYSAAMPVRPDQLLGSLVSVTGAQAVMKCDLLGDPQQQACRLSVGKLVKILLPESAVVGLVSAISVPMPEVDGNGAMIHLAELSLLGEFVGGPGRDEPGFQRGVTQYPSFGDEVYPVEARDLEIIYGTGKGQSIVIGQVQQDAKVAATIRVQDFLSKHFAILGATGVGKSCAVALMLDKIMDALPSLRVFLIDPHNEYHGCFGDKAEIVSPKDVNLPFWLFNFEEIVDVIFQARAGIEEEVDVLAELIPQAKMRFATNQRRGQAALARRDDLVANFSVDTPVPYRISDLIGALDARLGKLENRANVARYRRLKARIETVSQDPRYRFMFGSLTIEDTMAQVLARLFRLPTEGKPLTIMELAGFPAEVVDAVVSVLCRLAFDFGVWSEGAVPLLLVAEEAHRYVPADSGIGFGPTKRAISRIAKEGRKYGVYLGVVTQRPAELDATILSQCNTVFAMRLLNDRDQEIVRSAVSDSASSMLAFLPALGAREAVAFGEGVQLPMRLKFEELPAARMPRSQTAGLDRTGVLDPAAEDFIESVVRRWRSSVAHDTGGHETGAHDMAVQNVGVTPMLVNEPEPPPGAPEPASRPLARRPLFGT